MSLYLAFLRAINVGGRNVKMADLKRHLVEAGHEQVETFIASGNLLLQSSLSPSALEKRLEDDLHKALGYQVDTFVRTDAEVRALADSHPFGADPDGRVYVAFLKKKPPAALKKFLAELESPDESFVLDGRELFWLCRISSQDARFSGAALEKALGGPATVRNRNTIDRMVKKLD